MVKKTKYLEKYPESKKYSTSMTFACPKNRLEASVNNVTRHEKALSEFEPTHVSKIDKIFEASKL